MSGSPRSISMVRRVGGVSFDQVAKPREGLAIDSIYLEYDSLATDGNRLKVSFFSDDTKTITARIPDWQLIPISNYANSEFTALVSLYGENISLDKSQIVYHESVLNSLLGLRGSLPIAYKR